MGILSGLRSFMVIFLTVMMTIPLTSQCGSIPHFTIFTEHWPPYQYIEQDELKGFSVDVLELILKRTGSSQNKAEFQVVPWARGVYRLSNNPKTMLFLMTRTKERNSRFKWVGPLIHNVSYIIVKRGNNVDLSDKKVIKNYTAGAINGDISEVYLKSVGFADKNISFTVNSTSLVSMLNHGRVDLIVDNWLNFKSTVDKLSLDLHDFETIDIARKNDVSYAFSIDTPDWVIEKMQNKFDELVSDGTVEIIRKKYNIEPEIQFNQ